MQVYFGVRAVNGCKVFTWDTEKVTRPVPLPMAQEVFNHSPDGPEWGHSGSGPAQLALAMLYHATGNKGFALALHQDVKADLVARLPADVWARSDVDILQCALRVARNTMHRDNAAHYLALAMNRKTINGETPNG